jgi:hypothetical protein
MSAWARIDGEAGHRFAVYVDVALEAGALLSDVMAAREAGSLLLGLPWELLHDGDSFLFQGAKPTQVRRRLPSTRALDVTVVGMPIRILLVTARPENEACGYIDHRASALPLVEAMEELGGLVRFVEAFYDRLASGGRVGDAMLEGQRKLKDDTFRGRIFGAGELRLEDWFVPVLFQEKEDPQLFHAAVGRCSRRFSVASKDSSN